MKQVLVLPTFEIRNDGVCRKCLKELSCHNDDAIVIRVQNIYWSGFKSHVFNIVKVANPWNHSNLTWRVYGQPLCGCTLSSIRRDEPPYELLWLPRLFQFVNPEDRQALEEALVLMALAGEM